MTSTDFTIRIATSMDEAAICQLIGAAVRGLQPEYTAAQREAALATVFTVDTRLLTDGTYFVALVAEELVACGGWSFRKTLYGGDRQVESPDVGVLDPTIDAAKIRAIFVHPAFARRGLGGHLLHTAEQAALAAGFTRLEMGSTLAGLGLYTEKGYRRMERVMVPVGSGEEITVVRMVKLLS